MNIMPGCLGMALASRSLSLDQSAPPHGSGTSGTSQSSQAVWQTLVMFDSHGQLAKMCGETPFAAVPQNLPFLIHLIPSALQHFSSVKLALATLANYHSSTS